MKALSIRQPWAWLIVQGYKDIENRSWNPSLRDRFLVHASKGKVPEKLYIDLLSRLKIDIPDKLPKGCIIGSVVLEDVKKHVNSPWYIPGNFGLILKDPLILNPIPCKGQLGFFDPFIENAC